MRDAPSSSPVSHLRSVHGGPTRRTQSIEGAYRAELVPCCDVGVDHRRLKIRMAEKLLHGPDVVAGLHQVSREAVPQRVNGRSLLNTRLAERSAEHALKP